MDVVREIGTVPVDAADRPCEDVLVVNCGEIEFPGRRRSGAKDGGAHEGHERAHRKHSRSRSRERSPRRSKGRGPGRTSEIGEASDNITPQQATDANDLPQRGRSIEKSMSPEQPRDRDRDHHHHHRSHRSHRHRSRSPRNRSRSPRRHHHRRHDGYNRDDDPEAEERIAREERIREAPRQWRDESPLGTPLSAPPPPAEGEVKFKGRGAMRYRERKRWGQADGYGRLN